jgi:taurine dioxygenase
VEIIPQGSSFGAEICGLDLSQPLDDEGFEGLNRAFLDYQVLFLRGQRMSPRQYQDLALRFGRLAEYLFADGLEGFPYITEIVKTEDETRGFGDFWHSDSTYLESPPKITMLYARQLPPRGGDTLFSNMYAVYDALSPGLRTLLESLVAVN